MDSPTSSGRRSPSTSWQAVRSNDSTEDEYSPVARTRRRRAPRSLRSNTHAAAGHKDRHSRAPTGHINYNRPVTWVGGAGLDARYLASLSVPKLRVIFRETFGQPTASNNGDWLRRKLAEPADAHDGCKRLERVRARDSQAAIWTMGCVRGVPRAEGRIAKNRTREPHASLSDTSCPDSGSYAITATHASAGASTMTSGANSGASQYFVTSPGANPGSPIVQRVHRAVQPGRMPRALRYDDHRATSEESLRAEASVMSGAFRTPEVARVAHMEGRRLLLASDLGETAGLQGECVEVWCAPERRWLPARVQQLDASLCRVEYDDGQQEELLTGQVIQQGLLSLAWARESPSPLTGTAGGRAALQACQGSTSPVDSLTVLLDYEDALADGRHQAMPTVLRAEFPEDAEGFGSRPAKCGRVDEASEDAAMAVAMLVPQFFSPPPSTATRDLVKQVLPSVTPRHPVVASARKRRRACPSPNVRATLKFSSPASAAVPTLKDVTPRPTVPRSDMEVQAAANGSGSPCNIFCGLSPLTQRRQVFRTLSDQLCAHVAAAY